MNAIVITPKSSDELNFINKLLQRLKINSHELSVEEIEDIGLSKLMKKVDRKKKVSRETIFKKLNA